METSSSSSNSSRSSRLSKEEIDQILESPYDTGYTYTESAAYVPDGSTEYRHPQLCRRIRASMNAPYHQIITTKTSTIGLGSWSGGIGRTAAQYLMGPLHAVGSLSRSLVINAVTCALFLLQTAATVVAMPIAYTASAIVWLFTTDFWSHRLHDLATGVEYVLLSTASTTSRIAHGTGHIGQTSASYTAAVWRAFVSLTRETVIFIVAAVVYIVRAVLTIPLVPILYVRSFVSEKFQQSSIGSPRAFAPQFTSTPVNHVDVLRRGRPLRSLVVEKTAESDDIWRRIGRFLGTVLHVLFWLLVIALVVFVLFVVLPKLSKKYQGAVSSTSVDGGASAVSDFRMFQEQIDALRSELNTVVSRLKAVWTFVIFFFMAFCVYL